MKVIYQSREFSKRELYQMRKQGISLKSIDDGATFVLNDVCAYDGEDHNGNAIRLYAFFTDKGIIVTQSETAYKESIDIMEDFGSGQEVRHVVGKSKAGREYHTLQLV